jgi:hypothetical protein
MTAREIHPVIELAVYEPHHHGYLGAPEIQEPMNDGILDNEPMAAQRNLEVAREQLLYELGSESAIPIGCVNI